MANEFQSIESGAGTLQDSYPDKQAEALKRRRKKLAESKGNAVEKDEITGVDE
jgi:hypothetical protein